VDRCDLRAKERAVFDAQARDVGAPIGS